MVFPSFIMHLMGRARAKDRKGEKKTNEAQYGEHGKGMRERTRKKKALAWLIRSLAALNLLSLAAKPTVFLELAASRSPLQSAKIWYLKEVEGVCSAQKS